MDESNSRNANNTRGSTKAGRPATIRTSGAKGTPATAGMPATARMQATAVMPATSKSKDDSNSMTAQCPTQQNTRNSRNESNNRTVNTVGQPKARMLAKVVKPATACREANCSRDTIKSEMTAAGTIGTSWMSTPPRPPESDNIRKSATSEKPATCSRDASNISRNLQLEC
jgi:hypothetical protein